MKTRVLCSLVLLITLFGRTIQDEFLDLNQDQGREYDDGLEEITGNDDTLSDNYDIWSEESERENTRIVPDPSNLLTQCLYYENIFVQSLGTSVNCKDYLRLNLSPINFDGSNFIISQDINEEDDEISVRFKREADASGEGSGAGVLEEEEAPLTDDNEELPVVDETDSKVNETSNAEETSPIITHEEAGANIDEASPPAEEAPPPVEDASPATEETYAHAADTDKADETPPAVNEEAKASEDTPVDENPSPIGEPPVEPPTIDEEPHDHEHNHEETPAENEENKEEPSIVLSGRSMASAAKSDSPVSVDEGDKDAIPLRGSTETKPNEGEEKKQEGNASAARATGQEGAANQKSDADAKAATPETKTGGGGGGGQITLLIVAAIVIIGAAAFTYNYCKKRMTPSSQPEPDKELVEITVNKRVDPTETPGSVEEKKQLLENNKNVNGVPTEDKERKAEKEENERRNGDSGPEDVTTRP